MAVARIPQIQQDALPLITLDPTINGGTVVVLGGKILRQFSPTDLGINNAVFIGDPDGGTGAIIVGGFVDLTGTNNVSAIVTRTANLLATDNATGDFGITVYFQQRDFAGNNPRTGPFLPGSATNINNVTTRSGGVLAVPPGYPFSAPWARYGISNEANTGTGQGSPMGNAVRFVLAASTGPAAGMTFSLSVWAQG